MAWKTSKYGTCSLCENEEEVGKAGGGLLVCQSCHDIIEEEFFRVDKKTVKLAQFDDNVLKKIKEKKASIKKEAPKPVEAPVAAPAEKPKEEPARPADQAIVREIRTHLEKVNELLGKL
jgi:hypothetical protein